MAQQQGASLPHAAPQKQCCQQQQLHADHLLALCSLSRLWDSLKEDFERHGFYQSGSLPGDNNRQRGVVRVNCIDCLDRTNVVQGLLGRKHLEYVLDRAGLLDATDILALPNTFPQACVHQHATCAMHCLCAKALILMLC